MVNKTTILFLLVSIFALAFISAASDTGKNIPLYKDGASNAQVLLWSTNNIQVIGYSLVPNQKYVLAYKEDKPTTRTGIGSSYTNFPSPTIKCVLKTLKTDSEGGLSLSDKFDYSKLTADKKNERFFLIAASDITCSSGRVRKYDESKYWMARETL